MLNWVRDHETALWVIGIASAVMFVASLVIMPAMIVRIRPDYFAHDKRPPGPTANYHPVVRGVLIVCQNLLGALLIIAGTAMLALPGQGLLTAFVGFFLLDFPAKYRLEQWIVSRRRVLSSINWLRRRAGRAELQVRKDRR
jgi:hypothetical protein